MWLILITIVIICLTVNYWKNRKLIKLSKQLKSDYLCLPFVGHAYKLIGNESDRMNVIKCTGQKALEHGGISSLWLGNLYICIADPELAEILMKKFLEKGETFSHFGRSSLGNGIVFAPVNIWRLRRKIMAQNFTSTRLNQYVRIFAKESEIMIGHLQDKVNSGPFSVWNYLTTVTLDSIFEIVTCQAANSQNNHNHPLIQNIKLGCDLLVSRIAFPWQHYDIIYKYMPVYSNSIKCLNFFIQYFGDVVKSTRKLMKDRDANIKSGVSKDNTEQHRFKSFLEVLVECSGGSEKGFTDLELREEATNVVIAATDTSACSAGFTLVMLSRHPDVQDKVDKELKEVFGDSKRAVTHEDLPRLKYLDAVIKESLRLYPPVPIIVRQCDEDFTLPSGVTLIKGCEIVTNIWAINRNKKYWGDDAESFRPERFLDTPLKHPAQFMSFSYGPRNCIGYRYGMMFLKTNLSTLLRNYHVLPAATTAPTTSAEHHKPLRLKFSLLMKDADDFMIQLEPRNF